MVKEVKLILDKYAVDLESAKKDQLSILDITGMHHKLPEIRLQFFNSELYSIEFINNDFFELTNSSLILVLQSILNGSYEVKKSIFGNYSIRVKTKNGYIIPERIYKLNSDQKTIYNHLPAAFTLKNS